jgi:ribosomal protein S18 acetylase RimI-like enzyme
MQFPGAEEAVFLHDGGRPLGAAIIYREPGSVLLVDLAFLPEARGAGRGTRFVRELLREAAAAGWVVRLHVLRGSRALAFYDRLGFRVVEDDDAVYLGLESPGRALPPPASPPGPLP